jgi:glyoxylase-like metal-dependent hydrolase (beta-lactamase superfamily II)
MRGLWRGVSLLCVWAGVASAQRGPGFDIDFDQVQVRTEHVAGQVHMLAGAGGNLGVFAGEDGVFLVDDQFAPLTGRIREAIAAISGEPIRFIINTHFHDDHTGGNENFGEAGTLIVAHDNVRRTLAVPHFIETVNTEFPAFAPSALPAVTFSDAVIFHLNGEEVEVFHTPSAHTDGDAIVYFRGSDVIHMGDIFRSRGPVFDRHNGGSLPGMIAASDLVLSMMGADTKLIPGHGRVSSREDLLRARDSMVVVRDRIAAGVAAGKTLAEIIAENPTAGFEWSSPRLLTLERVIEWIYLELSEDR